MSGKRNLSGGGEDSDVARVTRPPRKYKRGLREVELTRDLLHLLCREANRLGQHGQLISTEARLGENITSVVAVIHSAFQIPELDESKQENVLRILLTCHPSLATLITVLT